MATTTADDTHDEPAEQRQPSLLASFSRADVRLLLVTFAGTVAANLMTVMVVAVAVILDRPRVGWRPTPGILLVFLGCFLSGVFGVRIGWVTLRDTRQRGRIRPMIGTVAAGLLTLESLLILLGWAVGVK